MILLCIETAYSIIYYICKLVEVSVCQSDVWHWDHATVFPQGSVGPSSATYPPSSLGNLRALWKRETGLQQVPWRLCTYVIFIYKKPRGGPLFIKPPVITLYLCAINKHKHVLLPCFQGHRSGDISIPSQDTVASSSGQQRKSVFRALCSWRIFWSQISCWVPHKPFTQEDGQNFVISTSITVLSPVSMATLCCRMCV